MTGSLSVRKGVWYCVLYYRNNEGQHKQKWVSTGLKSLGNKKDAKLFLDEKLQELAYLETLDEVEYVRKKPELSAAKDKNIGDKTKEKPLSKQPFVDYIDKYIENLKDELSPSVYFNYRHSTFKAIKEYFTPMKLRLCDVTTKHIQGFYDMLKKRGLKNISLKHYGNFIRPALRRAYKEKLISENPYDFMPTLKRKKVQHHFYDQQDMDKFFEVIKGHHLELVFRMLAFYGLRRSEVLGIRWEAIDFINKTLTVNHKVLNVNNKLYLSDTMKTETSCRTLRLFRKWKRSY